VTATARTRRYGVETQLPAVWSVRTVSDCEAFCQEIVETTIRRQAMPRLEPCDAAEAIAFLLGQVVILDQQFDGEQQRKPYLRFDLWLRTALACDLIDFWRSPAGFGRHGQHRTAAAAEQGLDDRAAEHGGWDDDAAAAGSDRLDPATVGDPADSFDARRWLDSEADRDQAGPHTLRGLRGAAGEAVSRRGGGAGVGAAGRVGAAAAGASVVAAFVDCGCGWRSYRQSPNGVTRWHLPDFCVGCGAALLEPVESVPSGSGGLEERQERAA
jgi:hypothetical protein